MMHTVIRKRWLALALALMLALCAAPASAEADPVELSILLPVGAPCGLESVSEDDLYFQLIEEGTGIHFTPVAVSMSNFTDKVSLLIASRDLPDVVSLRAGARDFLDTYGPQGAFLCLSDHWDALENVAYWMDLRDAEEFTYVGATSPDGQIYGAPMFNFNRGCGSFILYREDVFKANGIALPTSFDEFTDTLRALKAQYPDSIPFSSPDGSNCISNLAYQFGTVNGVYYDAEAGEYVDGRMSEAFESLIFWMQTLYNEGLLDPDIYSMTSDLYSTRILNGTILTYAGYATWGDNLTKTASSENADFRLSYMPQLEYDGARHPVQESGFFYPTICWAIASDTRDEAASLSFLNWLYGEEGINAASWGREGETYEVIDGKNYFMQHIITPRSLNGTVDAVTLSIKRNGYYGVQPYMETFYGPANQAAYATLDEYGLTLPLQPKLAWTQEDIEEREILVNQIDTYLNENVAKVILNNMAVEEWRAVVEDVSKNMNLDRLLALYNATYAATYAD